MKMKKTSELLPYQYYDRQTYIAAAFTALAIVLGIFAACGVVPYEVILLSIGIAGIIKNTSISQYLAATANVFIPAEEGRSLRSYFRWALKEIIAINGDNKRYLFSTRLLCWFGALPLTLLTYTYAHFLLGGLNPANLGVKFFILLLYLVSLRNFKRYVVVRTLYQLEREMVENMREAEDLGCNELTNEEATESSSEA